MSYLHSLYKGYSLEGCDLKGNKIEFALKDNREWH